MGLILGVHAAQTRETGASITIPVHAHVDVTILDQLDVDADDLDLVYDVLRLADGVIVSTGAMALVTGRGDYGDYYAEVVLEAPDPGGYIITAKVDADIELGSRASEGARKQFGAGFPVGSDIEIDKDDVPTASHYIDITAAA